MTDKIRAGNAPAWARDAFLNWWRTLPFPSPTYKPAWWYLENSTYDGDHTFTIPDGSEIDITPCREVTP